MAQGCQSLLVVQIPRPSLLLAVLVGSMPAALHNNCTQAKCSPFAFSTRIRVKNLSHGPRVGEGPASLSLLTLASYLVVLLLLDPFPAPHRPCCPEQHDGTLTVSDSWLAGHRCDGRILKERRTHACKGRRRTWRSTAASIQPATDSSFTATITNKHRGARRSDKGRKA